MALPICGHLPIVICEQLSFVDNCGQLLSRSTKSTIDQIDKTNRHAWERGLPARDPQRRGRRRHIAARPEAAPPSAAGRMPALPGIFQPRHLSTFQPFNYSTFQPATACERGLPARDPRRRGRRRHIAARPEAAPPSAAGRMPALPGIFQPRHLSTYHPFNLSAACGRRRLKIIYDAFFF